VASLYGWLRLQWRGPLVATVATAALTAALAPFRDEVGLLNVGLLYLLLTLLIAAFYGREVGLLAAVLTNLCLNFFFIDPLYKFTVQEPRNVIALVIFLMVSVIGGTLLSLAREAAQDASRRQAETEVALRLSRAMSAETEPDKALDTVCETVTQAFAAAGAAVLTRDATGWKVEAHAGAQAAARGPDSEERTFADRAADTRTYQSAGEVGLLLGRRRRVVSSHGLGRSYGATPRSLAFVPLLLGETVVGVLRLDGPMGASPFRDQPASLLSAVAGEAAVALQRMELARSASHGEALREADALKTALMASISHDLKTPLAGIKAAISSILDASVRWSPEDMEAFHRTIDSQADRLNRVISDILDLNRIESGSLQPEHGPVNALALLRGARDATAFETAGREVVVDAPEALELVGDESLLMQALVNLVENAVKYSRQGGAIHLSAAMQDGDAVLTVVDEGPGIAPEDLPYVFERFYRAEEHSRRVKGSGLGLSIVKGFVELCGGSVSVESSPQSTRFLIRLPAVVAARVPA
jgi:two-component system sensor histidine kinase KdpD